MSPSRRKVSFFIALCLFCAIVEFAIPKPSFIRIGFSNLPIMIAIASGLGSLDFCILVISKILCQSLLGGTLFSYTFILSLCCNIASSCTMYMIGRKSRAISFIGISVIGALVSNVVQIIVSSLFLGKGVYALGPIIIGVGTATSALLGYFAQCIVDDSVFFKTLSSCEFSDYVTDFQGDNTKKLSIKWILLVVVSAAVLLVVFFSKGIVIPAIALMAFIVANLAMHRHVSIQRIITMMLFTTLTSLLVPSGKVLATAAGLRITQQALLMGLRRGLVILCSIHFSKTVIPSKADMQAFSNHGNTIGLALFYFDALSLQWDKNKEKAKKQKLLGRIDETIETVISALS